MWNDKYNPDLLFVGSFSGQNGLEYIDLREGKRWNIVKIEDKTHSFSNMFGIGTVSSWGQKRLSFCRQ